MLETRGQSDRRRCIPAGAAAEHDTHHGIVQPVHDVAIMEEPIIGNGGQKPPCFLIVRTLRHLRERHDKRPVNVPQQRWCNGVLGSMNPRVAYPGATALAMRSGPVAGKITIAAAALLSSASS